VCVCVCVCVCECVSERSQANLFLRGMVFKGAFQWLGQEDRPPSTHQHNPLYKSSARQHQPEVSTRCSKGRERKRRGEGAIREDITYALPMLTAFRCVQKQQKSIPHRSERGSTGIGLRLLLPPQEVVHLRSGTGEQHVTRL
jgi:hypothetical protein